MKRAGRPPDAMPDGRPRGNRPGPPRFWSSYGEIGAAEAVDDGLQLRGHAVVVERRGEHERVRGKDPFPIPEGDIL